MKKEVAGKFGKIQRCMQSYYQNSRTAKYDRMLQNRENFDVFNMKQNFSHKRPGQSREFLPKQKMAIEQLTSFMQQGLIDFGDWFGVEDQPGINKQKQKISSRDVELLTKRQLELAGFYVFMGDMIKMGILGSLMIVKVHGQSVFSNVYRADKSKSGLRDSLKKIKRNRWRLKLDLVRHEDYYPDPTGLKLYEMERIDIDKYKFFQMAEEDNKKTGKWDMDAVYNIQEFEDQEQRMKKSRERDQNIPVDTRGLVEIFEFYGNIIDPDTHELLFENVYCVVDKGWKVLREPTPMPYWHGESPYVVEPILRNPGSVWHSALADAPTKHNLAMNEIYNLSLDGALMAIFGIKQLRPSWLEDPGQVSDGIGPGDTISVNSTCPPGGKALERVDTNGMTNEGMALYQLTEREFQQSALTNDTRIGATAERNVKATEIIAANQSLTGIFNGVVKTIESGVVVKVLRKVWLVTAQHMNDIEDADVRSVIGDQSSDIINGMTNEEIFAETANGTRFNVFGLSTTLNKIKEFQKITSLMQTISSSPYLLEAFLKKYNPTKLLDEIFKNLNIDPKKLEADEQQMQQNNEMIQRVRQNGTQNQGMSGVPQMMSGERQQENSPVDRSALASFAKQG